MSRLAVTMFCVAAAASGAATIAGCSDDIPADAVAKVDDRLITKAEFDRWLRITAATSGDEEAPVYDPSSRAACVAAKRGEAGRQGGGPPEARLEEQCRRELDELKSEVMSLLIRAEWVGREAGEEGIDVSGPALERSLKQLRREFFSSPEEYRDLLERSGMTRRDILFRLRIDFLENKLREKAVTSQGRVSDREMQAYYKENTNEFVVPQQRNLLLVATGTKSSAEDAKDALEAGRGWRSVVREYSADENLQPGDHRMRDVTRYNVKGALERAAFDATEGRLVGPFRYASRWYVLEVRAIRPRRRQPLSKVRQEIGESLRSARREQALEDFEQAFHDEYRERTTCADDYLVAECENGPDEAQDDEEA